MRDFEGNTPLHYACWNGNLEICVTLLKAGASVDAQDQTGRTPLYYSVQHKHPDIVRFLLENHSDPTIQTCTGVTPESLANQEHLIAIIEIFQQFEKEINEKNSNNGNDANNNENNNSSENLLGKNFTEEHNRMKIAIDKLIEGRDKESDMLQMLQGSLEEHVAALSAVQFNIKDTTNQLKTIEQVLKKVVYVFNSMNDANYSSSMQSESSFAIQRQNIPQMPSSTNGSAFPQNTGPGLAFTGLNSTSGSSFGLNNSNINVAISPLLPPQNEQKRIDKDQTKMSNEPSKSKQSLCMMCKIRPATMRCKYCRSTYCNECTQIIKQKGRCPNCAQNGKVDKS